MSSNPGANVSQVLRVQVGELVGELSRKQIMIEQIGSIAHLGTWILDPDANQLTWSDEVKRIYEVPLDQQPSLDEVAQFYPPEYAPALEQAVQKCLTDGTSFDMEMQIITARGRHLWVRAVGTPDEEAGKIQRIWGIFQDIDERKRAEEMLRESETRYRAIIESRKDLIVRSTPEGNFTYVNNQYVQTFGKSRHELYNSSFGPLVHEDDLTVALAELAKLKNGTASTVFFEQRAMTVNGWRWFDWECYAVRDGDGNMIEIQSVGRDIHDRKMAEQEREILQRQVIEAQRAALHELSTPLIPLLDGILIMPLVGNIDTARARDIMRSMLKGIGDHRAKIVILDITGVPLVDSGVASHLNKAILAARLKGVNTIITGISDAVAETIVDLGIDWSNIETQRDLQGGVMSALARKGLVLRQARVTG